MSKASEKKKRARATAIAKARNVSRNSGAGQLRPKTRGEARRLRQGIALPAAWGGA